MGVPDGQDAHRPRVVRIQKEILSILDVRVVVDRATKEAVGFFSFSWQFATRQEARTYLADSIGPVLA